MQTSIDVTVEPDHLDDLGHVNNTRYLDYLERGRRHWYTASGFWRLLDEPAAGAGTGQPEPANEQEPPGFGTVVVSIRVDFRRELFAGDVITITTRPLRKRRTSYVLSQAITTRAGEPACDAELTCLVMDLASRRPIPLPAACARLLEGGAP